MSTAWRWHRWDAGWAILDGVNVRSADAYYFRIVVPPAEIQTRVSYSACNSMSSAATMELQKCEGISKTEQASWAIGQSVSAEIGGALGMTWSRSFSESTTLSQETCVKLTVTVNSGKKGIIRQGYGTYGPYRVKTHDYHLDEEPSVQRWK